MSKSSVAKAPPSVAADAPEEIATIRIELADTEPLVWREVEAPTSITLKTLHDIVQRVMNWEDYHLWEFTIAGRRYGPPMDDWGDAPRFRADAVRLCEVLKPRKTTIEYVYDFGDSWEHRLVVEKRRAGEPALAYPRLIRGARNAPPEDCGGIGGFYDLLDARDDPHHDRHEEADEWLGDYDAALFDRAAIDTRLLRRAAPVARRADEASDWLPDRNPQSLSPRAKTASCVLS
jgi:hypothetical protein